MAVDGKHMPQDVHCAHIHTQLAAWGMTDKAAPMALAFIVN